jgi:broad specificity phosphatase PhoE
MLSLQRATATAVLSVVMFGSGACATAAAGDPPAIPDGKSEITIYLVRHAEKASDTEEDPNLSEKGRARAESLAVQLRDSGVNMIITTDLKRTQQTAAPLAKLRHINPIVIPIGSSVDTHVKRIISEIQKHQGATILVVGHNNTIAKVAEQLAGGHIGDLCTDEYANMLIIVLTKGHPAKLLLDSYGVPDPPSSPSCAHLPDR